MLEVAIIGAGISGIITGCKLNNIKNVNITIYDYQDKAGGIWNHIKKQGGKFEYSSFKDTFYLTDFNDIHMKSSNDLVKDIYIYINKLINNNKLESKLKLNTKIINTDFDKETKKWKLSIQEENVIYFREVDYICCCMGRFGADNIPVTPYLTDYMGEIVKSINYTSNLKFNKHNILIIGAGDVSFDIAADIIINLLNENKDVTNIQIDISMNENNLFNSENQMRKPKKMNNFFSTLSAHWKKNNTATQMNNLGDKSIEDKNIDALIKEEYINLIFSKIKKIDKKLVEFENGNKKEYEYIIVSSQIYHARIFTLFNKYINPENKQLFYQSMFHPNLPRVFILGHALSKYSTPSIVSIQINNVISILQEKKKFPSVDEMDNNLENNLFYETREELERKILLPD